MKKLLTLLLFSNILLSLLQAQPVHQIKGTVIEKNSRQPLEFINVMVLGLNKGGVTNAEGHFTIEQVPPGIFRLQATMKLICVFMWPIRALALSRKCRLRYSTVL